MRNLTHLFSAHHADKNFISKSCGHYYCEVLSIASFTDALDQASPPYRHRHDAYEFLIPYGPIPLIMCEETVYFGVDRSTALSPLSQMLHTIRSS